MTKSENIRIIIADDHQMMREGLQGMLEAIPGMEVVGLAADGIEAFELVAAEKPDVVIMDISMPKLNGVDATRKILSDFPGIRIVAVSMHSDRQLAAEILRIGALGFLLKECAVQELVAAINAVYKGEIYLCKKMVGAMVDAYVVQGGGHESQGVRVLSGREREVLQMLSEGECTKTIANKLSVSSKTIETHRRQIMTKLDVSSVAELTKYALRMGLTTLDC